MHVVSDHFPLPLFFTKNVRGADGDFLELALDLEVLTVLDVADQSRSRRA